MVIISFVLLDIDSKIVLVFALSKSVLKIVHQSSRAQKRNQTSYASYSHRISLDPGTHPSVRWTGANSVYAVPTGHFILPRLHVSQRYDVSLIHMFPSGTKIQASIPILKVSTLLRIVSSVDPSSPLREYSLPLKNNSAHTVSIKP